MDFSPYGKDRGKEKEIRERVYDLNSRTPRYRLIPHLSQQFIPVGTTLIYYTELTLPDKKVSKCVYFKFLLPHPVPNSIPFKICCPIETRSRTSYFSLNCQFSFSFP